jgi:hypothetical protein
MTWAIAAALGWQVRIERLSAAEGRQDALLIPYRGSHRFVFVIDPELSLHQSWLLRGAEVPHELWTSTMRA